MKQTESPRRPVVDEEKRDTINRKMARIMTGMVQADYVHSIEK